MVAVEVVDIVKKTGEENAAKGQSQQSKEQRE